MTQPQTNQTTPARTRRGEIRVGFTEENLAALEKMKSKKYELGVAEKKYVNHILFPDGSVVADKDGARMIEAARAMSQQVLKGDTSDPKVLRAAAVMADKVKEIEDHVAQKRFLFIVDEYDVPVIYFQCDTPDNPDRETWR